MARHSPIPGGWPAELYLRDPQGDLRQDGMCHGMHPNPNKVALLLQSLLMSWGCSMQAREPTDFCLYAPALHMTFELQFRHLKEGHLKFYP